MSAAQSGLARRQVYCIIIREGLERNSWTRACVTASVMDVSFTVDVEVQVSCVMSLNSASHEETSSLSARSKLHKLQKIPTSEISLSVLHQLKAQIQQYHGMIKPLHYAHTGDYWTMSKNLFARASSYITRQPNLSPIASFRWPPRPFSRAPACARNVPGTLFELPLKDTQCPTTASQ